MLTFTECRTVHLPAVREFWAQVYGPAHVLGTNSALFDWQFGHAAGGRADGMTPDDGYHMHLAMDGAQVVGCLGFVPTDVMVHGRSVRGCWLANWKVAPAIARLGIGPLLLREVLRTVDVVVNVGISEEAKGLLARLGWLDLGALTRWVCPLDPTRADALLDESVTGAWPDVAPRATSSPSFAVREVQAFDGDAGRLWDTLWGTNGAGTRRSAELLNWRYVQHPVFRYELLEVRTVQQLVGFAVYRVEAVREPALTVGRIVELVATTDALPTLIGAVCDHALLRDVAMLDFFCTSRRMNTALEEQGFQRGDSGRAAGMPQLFQPLDRRRTDIACMIAMGKIDMPNTRDDWYVTKGDADQDRPN